MRITKIFFFLCFTLNITSCSKDKTSDDVTFDTSFLGARLDSTKHVESNKYIAYISPAFEPVNESAYFAFAVSSKTNKEIEIQLNYGTHKHRYIPKLSTDKKTWRKIDDNNIELDTVTRTAMLRLNISSQKLFVAAQEIESSEDTYSWLDSILKEHPFLKKVIAGKTALKKDNYVINSNLDSKNDIVLIARQHPPESPGGTFGFQAFYEELLSDSETAKSFRNQFNIITFPLMNPDGVDMGNWRHNAIGVDLNRDWVNFTQPETQMVKSYVESKIEDGNQIHFAMDFHTSYSGPYLLILDSINEAKTKKIIPKWINNIKSNSAFKVESRRRSQELPYCYNYFYNQIGCEAVTYEDGDEIDREIIKNRAKVYARELMKIMLLKDK